MEVTFDANVSTSYPNSQINASINPKIQVNWTRKEAIERAIDLCRDIANTVSMTRAENWQSFAKKQFAHAVTNCLEALLTTALVPWTLWQWFSSNGHLVTILKIVFAVLLELTMWLVLAGVSIITAASFILEDLYRIADNADESSQNHHHHHHHHLQQISRQSSTTNNAQLPTFKKPVKNANVQYKSKPRD